MYYYTYVIIYFETFVTDAFNFVCTSQQNETKAMFKFALFNTKRLVASDGLVVSRLEPGRGSHATEITAFTQISCVI